MSPPLFGGGKALIGVVHLLPLPGSPRWGGDMQPVLERARREAGILASEGAAGIIVENFGDAPFHPGSVGPETVAAMTLAVGAVMDTVDVSVGINVLRNDPGSAIAIAAATGAHFVRANVHYGAMVADEGVVQGAAHDTLRYRRVLGVQERVKLFADVLVKHAVPLGADDAAHVARETVLRGLADALIVTGSATGVSASVEELKTVREAAPPASRCWWAAAWTRTTPPRCWSTPTAQSWAPASRSTASYPTRWTPSGSAGWRGGFGRCPPPGHGRQAPLPAEETPPSPPRARSGLGELGRTQLRRRDVLSEPRLGQALHQSESSGGTATSSTVRKVSPSVRPATRKRHPRSRMRERARPMAWGSSP